ncbi:DNA-processing protein DprA [Actinomadura parmotrematis]|uniref:DNA-processing protein DprA n=1 Tax=Actinomadura parmotrematis TaxID=2864039 RepID=A0ABS7G000_9ACTN|nr:DNA-processing protein DprA [Actinomadura parmotrematis]MBW8486029.1 DNA-processing protein DprA [Actinomadura parmotrematis]
MDDRQARATLAAIAEPGEALLNRIMEQGGPQGALEAVRRTELPAGFEVDGRMKGKAVKRLARWRIRLEQDPSTAWDGSDLRLVCPGEPEWPTTLDDLADERPYALWLRGPENLRYNCLRSVALVGARAASPYGLRVASDLGAELADRGWCVVSGGALGIDAAAHRGALAAGGVTVAVFANGVDVPYPIGNNALFTEMAQHGLLVSESPPGSTPRRSRFLVRNRVIAALSRGTVVVEAAWRSGALSTAAWARKLGREVMAVPGPVGSYNSAGCHRLLRDQPPALLVTRVEEIVEAVGQIGTDLAPDPAGPVLPRDRLEPDARTLLEAMPARGSVGPAQLAAEAGLDMATVNGKLGLLAAAGFVERSPTGWRLTPTAKAHR